MKNAKPGQHARRYFRLGDYIDVKILSRSDKGMIGFRRIGGNAPEYAFARCTLSAHESCFVSLKPKPLKYTIPEARLSNVFQRHSGKTCASIEIPPSIGSLELLHTMAHRKVEITIKEIK